MILTDWRGIWVTRDGGFAEVFHKNSKGFWVGWLLIWSKVGDKEYYARRGKKAWDSKGDHVRNRDWDLMARRKGNELKVLFQGTYKEWPTTIDFLEN